MSSNQYRESHCGDKTVVRPFYLHSGISFTGKATSLYWIGALNSKSFHKYEYLLQHRHLFAQSAAKLHVVVDKSHGLCHKDRCWIIGISMLGGYKLFSIWYTDLWYHRKYIFVNICFTLANGMFLTNDKSYYTQVDVIMIQWLLNISVWIKANLITRNIQRSVIVWYQVLKYNLPNTNADTHGKSSTHSFAMPWYQAASCGL